MVLNKFTHSVIFVIFLSETGYSTIKKTLFHPSKLTEGEQKWCYIPEWVQVVEEGLQNKTDDISRKCNVNKTQ